MSYFAKKCSNCKNYEGNIRICESCAHYDPPITVFRSITQSPEVLAEKLVYLVCSSYNGATNYYWRSTIIDKAWKTKQEAIAATVAKLEEIDNE